MRTLRFAVALFALGLTPLSASAQQTPGAAEIRVAVFPMTGLIIGDDNKALADAFRNMIMTELGLSGRFTVIERVEIDKLLESQVGAVSGMITNDQAVQIGRMLGAQYAVTGGVTIAGGDARLDLRMVDMETSATVSQPFKEQLPTDKLLSLVDRIATEFSSSAKVTARAEDVVVPPAVMLAYSRGLDYEARGEKQQAAEMFRTVLELFPRHPHARAALERVN